MREAEQDKWGIEVYFPKVSVPILSITSLRQSFLFPIILPVNNNYDSWNR